MNHLNIRCLSERISFDRIIREDTVFSYICQIKSFNTRRMKITSSNKFAGQVYETPVLSVTYLTIEGVLCGSFSDFGSDMGLLEEEDYDWGN